MPSIHDVAREAQVAPSTVSLVINGRSRVSRETREKVNQAIQKLGYLPRPRGAPQIASMPDAPAGKSSLRHLLVLVSRRAAATGEPDNLVRVWLSAIRDKCRDLGIHVSTHIGVSHIDDDHLFVSQLEDRSIDGIILMKTMDKDGYLNRVLDTGLPCLVMNHKSDGRRFHVITLDYRQAGRDIANRLLDLGHRSFAYLGDRHRWSLDEGATGLEEVLHDRGLSLDLDLSLDTSSPPALAKAAEQILKKKITAVVTFDPVAILLVNLLEEQGVDIPGQLSVMGFDHLRHTSKGGLRISSVGYDKPMMGVLAVQTLLQQVQAGHSLRSSQLIMSTHFTAGDTVGPAIGSQDQLPAETHPATP